MAQMPKAHAYARKYSCIDNADLDACLAQVQSLEQVLEVVGGPSMKVSALWAAANAAEQAAKGVLISLHQHVRSVVSHRYQVWRTQSGMTASRHACRPMFASHLAKGVVLAFLDSLLLACVLTCEGMQHGGIMCLCR